MTNGRKARVFEMAATGASAAVAQVTPSVGSYGVAPCEHLIGQPASVLGGMEFERHRRIISPGDAMATDFDVSRINFDLDEAGTILRL